MRDRQRWSAEWTTTSHGVLRAFEPTPEELASAAAPMAAFCNEPYNRDMMTNTQEVTAADMLAHYGGISGDGGRVFLLAHDGALVGDADLRHLAAKRAELSVLLGPRSLQGKGLGTRFLILVNALAFGVLGVERLYAIIAARNEASRRAFEKVGYLPDASPEARAFAEEDSELALSLTRERFEPAHREALGQVKLLR